MTSWLWIVTDKRFVTGATLPYIIGAQRVEKGTAESVLDESSSRGELEALLMSMRDDIPSPDCICIQHCSYVDGYVAASHRAPLTSRMRIQSPYHPDRGLYHCDKIYGQRIQGWDSLLEALWSNHRAYILERRFSREWVVGPSGKRRRDWLRFDECEVDERDEIRRTLANPGERSR